MNSMSRRIFVAAVPLVGVGLASVVRAQGNLPASGGTTLFQNVRIFDGKNSSLSAPSSVQSRATSSNASRRRQSPLSQA